MTYLLSMQKRGYRLHLPQFGFISSLNLNMTRTCLFVVVLSPFPSEHKSVLCRAVSADRKHSSPTPQVVHSNSSCPLHSVQVGWQRTHWSFSANCPPGHCDEGLHPIYPTRQRKIGNAARNLMIVSEDFQQKKQSPVSPETQCPCEQVRWADRCEAVWTPAQK